MGKCFDESHRQEKSRSKQLPSLSCSDKTGSYSAVADGERERQTSGAMSRAPLLTETVVSSGSSIITRKSGRTRAVSTSMSMVKSKSVTDATGSGGDSQQHNNNAGIYAQNKRALTSRSQDADVNKASGPCNSDNNDVVELRDSEEEATGDGEWKRQRRSRRRYRRTLGQSTEESTGFVGIQPKVWLYVSRVGNQVTEENIAAYVRKKIGENEKIVVKDVGMGQSHKSFVVAADFKFKEDFYSPTFWPKGVGFRRCGFDLMKKVIESGTPASFLETKK